MPTFNHRHSIDRLIAALTDPRRCERTIIIVLAAYVTLWTLFAVLAKSNQDIHYDSAELVAWSRALALGYPKHPPLAAWLVRGWFTIFQISDWTYYLLAMTSVTIALWIAWRLYSHLLAPDKRVAGLALLTLIPFFNFHALRFDHNTVLIPLWAGTTLCFFRSFETRKPLFAALTGAFAAGAMLGKYWSIFLLAGLGLAALTHPDRRLYFRSAAPWITIAVGLVLLSPHVAWSASHDFGPFRYALTSHQLGSFPSSGIAVLGYLVGGAGYAAFPTLLVLAFARPNFAALSDMVAPDSATRRFVATAFWLPLLLPAPLVLAAGLELNSTWVMSGLILLPVLLLSSPAVRLSRTALSTIVVIAISLPLAAVLAAPWFAIYAHRHGGISPTAAHGRLLAQRMDQEWRRTSDQPLRLVGGDLDLAYVTSFYLNDRPLAFPISAPELAPWVDSARIAHDGIVIVCHMHTRGPFCLHRAVKEGVDDLMARNPGSRQVEVEMTRSHFGIPGTPSRYIVVAVPPRQR